jgi:hypothetical protein
MHREFKKILDRVHDPKQVTSINDVSRVVIVPALAHLEERIERLEVLGTSTKPTREEYECLKKMNERRE